MSMSKQEKEVRDQRIGLLHAFLEVWDKYPDLRFGQLVSNISQEIALTTDSYYITDRDFMAKLEEKLDEVRRSV